MRRILVALLLMLYVLPLVSHGAPGINPVIPFTGTLRDAQGVPLSGAYDMIFRLYDAPAQGTLLWEGVYTTVNGNPVAADNGFFTVMLGEGVGNAFTIDFSDDTYYLGITVGTDPEMAPRERLGSVPYAFNARLLGGIDSSLFQRTDMPLSIQNSDESFIDGMLRISDGSGIHLGTEDDGLTLRQDIFTYGANDLVFDLRGTALQNQYVNLITPYTFGMSANAGDGSGTYAPTFVLGENGTAGLYNNSQGNISDRIFEINFDNGVRIMNGDLRIETGGVRIGTGEANEALDVDGQIRSSYIAGGPFALESDADGNIIPKPSDERLKKDVEPIDNALETLMELTGVRYSWRDQDRFGTSREVGFIAQDVERVLPEVVRQSGEYRSLNTGNMAALIVEAVKELSAKVHEYFTRTERLEAEVKVLRDELDALRGGEVSTTESEGVLTPEEVSIEVDDEATAQSEVVVESENTLDEGADTETQVPQETSL